MNIVYLLSGVVRWLHCCTVEMLAWLHQLQSLSSFLVSVLSQWGVTQSDCSLVQVPHHQPKDLLLEEREAAPQRRTSRRSASQRPPRRGRRVDLLRKLLAPSWTPNLPKLRKRAPPKLWRWTWWRSHPALCSLHPDASCPSPSKWDSLLEVQFVHWGVWASIWQSVFAGRTRIW